MPSQNTTVYSVAQVADFMVSGYWGGSSHAFDLNSERTLSVNISALPQDARQVALWALEAWTTSTGIRFSQTEGVADITFDDAAAGAYATSRLLNGRIVDSDVNVSTQWLEQNGVHLDSYSVMTYIHEIGHALGLGHPGDYEGGSDYGVHNDFANDSWQMSVLSYFSQRENTYVDASYAYVMTPMLADVQGIQMLYGKVALRTGNTVYGDGSTAGGTYDRISALRAAGLLDAEIAWTIVDDGGYDVLDVESSAENQVVDLRPEQISSVYGLTGNLAIEASSVIEEIRTGAGNDMIRARDTGVFALTGEGRDTVHGGAGDDVIVGAGQGANSFLGNGGNDTLRAGTGNDSLAGGDGNDRIFGGDGDNTIYLGLGDDFAGGGAGNDVIHAGAGNNEIYTGLGSDTVNGGAGRDTIFGGGDGRNTLLGNAGDDVIHAGTGGDLLGGGEGNDQLYGKDGDDVIYLGPGNDFAGGGAGNDVIVAGSGVNEIYGGFGKDTLHAGVGRDMMTGGPGADVFVFASAAAAGIGLARDVIADFEAGIDRIDLSALNLRFVGDGSQGGRAQGTTGDLYTLSGFVAGDVDRDGDYDFAIRLYGAPDLDVNDFIL